MSTSIERYVIRHISGSKTNQVEEFDFNKSDLSIGRAAGTDIQFDPEQDVVVSREHGKITKVSSDPPKFTISDNNSRNGVFVNKTRVKGSAILSPGDEVQLGSNGPVFSFDIYPRPQNMMMETKVMDIPTSIKATTVSDVRQTAAMSASAEPAKVGLGKQTVERMLVAERKKSYSSMAYIIGGLVIVLGVLGYVFKDKLMPTKVINNNTTKNVVDSSRINKRSAEQIAKDNDDRVVQIEFGWQLFDVSTGQELWHKWWPVKGSDGVIRYFPAYIENNQGQIEPYIDIQRNVEHGEPIGLPSGWGSGFVVSQDGHILTNRHIGAAWNTRYDFPNDAFPGILIRYVGNLPIVVPGSTVNYSQVFGWVPAETQVAGGYTQWKGSIQGRNTYMNVVFSGTSLRRPIMQPTLPSDEHDVCLLRTDIVATQSKVTMFDDYSNVKPGQSVTVMGYPGVAPQEFVARRSNDPFNPTVKYTTIPTPTVTPGSVGRIVPGSSALSAKNLTYSTFGDSYQLTINATGPGNSGGPLFDDEGRVIGIFYAGAADAAGTMISFAVPIKYGLELLGHKKVNNQ